MRVSRRQSVPFPTLSQVSGVLYYHEGVDPNEKNLPSVLDDVKKSAHGIPFNPTAQTAKTVGFTVRCEEFQKARLEVKIEEKRMTGSTKKDEEIVSYVRGLLLLSMWERGWRLKVSSNIFLSENISCTSNIELPDCSIYHYDCY